MASAITVEGIDQAISNLEYKNKNTLKYRFVQHIRQYYTSENSDVFPNEIDHEALIKMLWDTDHSLEAIKNKRRNLNSVRSSVNADLKKLYEKGKNPEGIKIGSRNIFEMSEEAKDKILNNIGLDLPPGGTLGLDQIMDILKLANETVSGSMAVEDTEKKDGLKKIDRLKDLIKGLSEKVGLGSPELSRRAPDYGAEEDGDGVGHDMAGKGDEDGSGSNEQLGLPVGSLGQEYSLEANSKITKDKILAEEFDGYLGSMDRHYNHYILIPGGEYIIGSKHPKKDEKSEQMVYLEPFYFGRFPITNGLFEIFVEKTGYKTTAEKVGYGTVYFGRFEKKKDETTGLITSTWNSSLYCKTIEGACWYQPSGPKSTLYNKRNHPVVQISMEDAMAFAAWTGKRLPTENEWEAASRTTNGRVFPWGSDWKQDACNIEDSCTADTTSVDKHAEFENDFGIVDTIGNVLEWTNDSFDSTSKNNHGVKYRAVKGGSWISGNDIRLFSRFLMEPESHSNILGFRCVAY